MNILCQREKCHFFTERGCSVPYMPHRCKFGKEISNLYTVLAAEKLKSIKLKKKLQKLQIAAEMVIDDCKFDIGNGREWSLLSIERHHLDELDDVLKEQKTIPDWNILPKRMIEAKRLLEKAVTNNNINDVNIIDEIYNEEI